MSDFKLLATAVLLAIVVFIAFQAIQSDGLMVGQIQGQQVDVQEINRSDIGDIAVVIPTETQLGCTGPKVYRDLEYCGSRMTFTATENQNKGDDS